VFSINPLLLAGGGLTRRGVRLRMLLRNLNAFFLTSVLLGTLLTWGVLATGWCPTYIWAVELICISLVFLTFIIKRRQMSQHSLTYHPEQEKRFKNGHKLLAVANLGVIITFIDAFAGTFGNSFIPVWLAVLIAISILTAWGTGLIMIKKPRLKPNPSFKRDA